MWRMRDIEIAGVMDTDRMHLNSFGHTHMAHAVLDALGVAHGLEPVAVGPLPVLDRRQQWRANAQWTREFLAPWVHRRITGRSSGDTVSPKRPEPVERRGSPGPVSFGPPSPDGTADVAQLVERDLPKVDVASSSLVIRSKSKLASATAATSMSRVRVSSSAPAQ